MQPRKSWMHGLEYGTEDPKKGLGYWQDFGKETLRTGLSDIAWLQDAITKGVSQTFNPWDEESMTGGTLPRGWKDLAEYTSLLGMFDQSGNFIDYKGIGGDNRFADGGVGRGNFAAIINQILKDNDIDNVEATTSAFYPNSIKLGDTRYGFTQNDWEYGKFMKALDKIIMGDGAVQYSAPTKEDDD